ncbi:MAG TPA: M56 family metallopeptidase [Terracidiphilus sp.]
MLNLSGFAASFLVNALWEPAAILVAAWLAAGVLKRLGPRAEHAVWVSALGAAVLAPALPILRMVPALLVGSPYADLGSQMILIADRSNAPAHAGVLSLPQAWFWSLFVVYAGCALVFAVRLALSLRGVVSLLRQARPAALPSGHDEVWRQCRNAFSIPRAQVLISTSAPGAVAVGLPRPVLLLSPDFAARCTPQDFLAAVAHECAHLKRRDFQKNLIYEMAGLPLAIHPLIWVIKSRVAQTREMICDAMATETYVDPRSYSRSLLRLAAMVAASPQPSARCAIGIFDAGILEKRIMRINLKKQQTRTIVRCGLIASAASILVSAAVGAAAAAVIVTPEAGSKTSAQAGANGHVYDVGHGVSAPIPLNRVLAKYPESARKSKEPINAVVLLRMVVDAEGVPQDVRVVHSYRPDFDAEAVKAAKKYRFKPAMLKGKPVAVSIKIEVNFKWY